jgi:glyoxylase-like metal-dependent hydrolase (beta-lactamase superfamily II)
MTINNFVGKIFETNTWLVSQKDGFNFICIDPSYGAAEQIIEFLRKSHGKLLYIINTHGHFDHIAENIALKKHTGAKIALCEKELENLKLQNRLMEEAKKIMRQPSQKEDILKKLEDFKVDVYLKDGDVLEMDGIEFKILETPGHTAGSICLYYKKEGLVFTGDTLFEGTYGRLDLPTAKPEKMNDSLRKLAALPPETRVYPGHGNQTTIAEEKKWIDKLELNSLG